jgi:hypothetical protein
MSTSAPESPSLARHRPFVLFWMARLASTMGYQMLAVTIGWQVYELTDSAFDLGLVGLIQFVPAVVLTLLIGHAADRYDRRLIVRTAHGVYALAAVMITAALLAGVLTRDLLFGAVFLIGCARAFELPTAHSLVPALVPAPMIARAVAALDLRQPGRDNLRPGAGRPDLHGQSDAGRHHLPGVFHRLDHARHLGARQRPGRQPRAADLRVGTGRV